MEKKVKFWTIRTKVKEQPEFIFQVTHVFQ